MSDLNYSPDYGSKLSKEPRVLTAQFGDGYAQRAADGLNNAPQVWDVMFNVPPADVDIIEALFESKGGVTPFTWTPPGKSQIKVICKKWERVYTSYGLQGISAQLQQDFSP
jgi:phage-related protein